MDPIDSNHRTARPQPGGVPPTDGARAVERTAPTTERSRRALAGLTA